MNSYCCYNTKFQNVTHVIFDLDGTLIDSEKIYLESLKKTVNDFGHSYTEDLSGMVVGKIDSDGAKAVIEHLNLDITIEQYLEKYQGYSWPKLSNLDLMPGAEKMIRHLHENQIPIALATSSQEESYTIKTERHRELFLLFHHIVCGGSDPEVKNGKPAPDIFLICASRFDDHPKPSECLVFEDSANGIKSALAAGMQVVMIPDEKVSYDIWKLATLRIDSFEYMMPELFGLPSFPRTNENLFEINPEIFQMKDDEDSLKKSQSMENVTENVEETNQIETNEDAPKEEQN